MYFASTVHFVSLCALHRKMPIVCESVKNLKEGGKYGSDKEFVLAYPNPIPITPLGCDWKFTPCFLPAKYTDYKDRIENFDVRPDDLFSLTFPKSGSTWSQEMIWLLNNDLDFKTAEKIRISERFLHLEVDICFKNLSFNSIEQVEKLPSPRHIKSHLPVGLLPQQIWTVKPKIIYIARDSKDNAISYYHHYKNFHRYNASKDDFLEAYLHDMIIFSPQLGHIKDFWHLRNEKNVLFLTFEEMKSDTFSVIQKTSSFLGKNYTDEQLLEVQQFISFDSMKSREDKEMLKKFLKFYAQSDGAADEAINENVEYDNAEFETLLHCNEL